MKRAAIFFIALTIPAGLPSQEATDPGTTRRPNILFIAIDDLNDWIGVTQGHPQSQTPNLNRLAGRGVLFRNAYCAAPACNPSRAALMTGIAPHQSGVYLNEQPWRKALPDAVTIPQYLRKGGYTVKGSGKIYHGAYPDPRSWDEFFPSKRQQKPRDPLPKQRPINGIANTRHFDWGPVNVKDDRMGDAKVANWVAEQLGKKHQQPLFLACGFYRPHLPWYVPKKYFDRFPLDEIQLPKVFGDDLQDIPEAGKKMAKPGGDHRKVVKHGQWKQAVQGYLASIAFTDTMLGRVLDALDASGQSDNTVIVLWTDHGWNLGEKQHWRKFALWENTTRTPLMIIVPKGTPGLLEGTSKGTVCTRAVSLLDIYPTLVELCALKPKPGLAGRSLVPLLQDANAAWERPALTTQGRQNHALRNDRWRYIRYADGSEELYDHQADPHEWRNLADESKHTNVKAQLSHWLPKTNAPDAPKRTRQKKK